jgi:hypothetical protein
MKIAPLHNMLMKLWVKHTCGLSKSMVIGSLMSKMFNIHVYFYSDGEAG